MYEWLLYYCKVRADLLPSMENTPSVTMSLCLAFPWSCSRIRSRSSISACLYRKRCAFDNRMPSMIDAWFKLSLMMASSGPHSCSKMPALASKQEEYRMVSSVPWKIDNLDSNCLWMSCVPQIILLNVVQCQRQQKVWKEWLKIKSWSKYGAHAPTAESETSLSNRFVRSLQNSGIVR